MRRRISGFWVTIEYKAIKNMNLYIKPPDGHLLITTPKGTPLGHIEAFIEAKKEWIIKTQKKVVARNSKEEKADKPTPKELEKLKEEIEELAKIWEPKMGVAATKYTIRDMKTRWGSCTPARGTIRISSRLIPYPQECLEYIVVHELCHLIEPSHNQRFKKYMTRFLPDWKERRKKLEE
ncbi:MAG TPA: M48 family metallopeptidase [Candidatus Dorea intestinavium]|nr:M48 family metallopeptidase [Candidatus Dorea intestinavium]